MYVLEFDKDGCMYLSLLKMVVYVLEFDKDGCICTWVYWRWVVNVLDFVNDGCMYLSLLKMGVCAWVW